MLMQTAGVDDKSLLCAAQRVHEALHWFQIINVTWQRLIKVNSLRTEGCSFLSTIHVMFCSRPSLSDFLKKKTVEVQAFLKAIQLYRQHKGKYKAWDMLIGSDVRVRCVFTSSLRQRLLLLGFTWNPESSMNAWTWAAGSVFTCLKEFWSYTLSKFFFQVPSFQYAAVLCSMLFK